MVITDPYRLPNMKSNTESRRYLNRNEVVQGPSPAVIAALRNFPADEANFYYDGYDGSALVPELSKKFRVPQDRIIVGYGAEYILDALFDRLDPAKDSALVNELHFDYYHIALGARGVPMYEFRLMEGDAEFSFDIEDCIAKIRALRPKLILVTSPNNPTGNALSARSLARILAAAPKSSIVAVDEAYYGFDDRYEEEKFLSLLRRHGNLMFIRTFSKLYALAGLRIGYALCGKNVKKMIGYRGRRLGGSRILETAAAAALHPSSHAYYRALAREIAAERDRAIRAVNALGHFKAFSSRANLFTVKVSPRVKAILQKEMAGMAPLVCRFYAPLILRVSVATREHMDSFITMMEKADRMARDTGHREKSSAAKKPRMRIRAPRIPRTAGRRA